jgi:hypothetical protein
MSYIALATTTLGSAASSVTFSSIPTSVNGIALRDLILIANYGSTNANTGLSQIQLNSDTGNNYNDVFMAGAPDNSVSSIANANIGSIRFLRNFFDVNSLTQHGIMQLFDFSQTNKQKSVLIRNGAPDRLILTSARWASTSAVDTLRIFTTDTFRSGSTFSLYGVA